MIARLLNAKTGEELHVGDVILVVGRHAFEEYRIEAFDIHRVTVAKNGRHGFGAPVARRPQTLGVVAQPEGWR